MDETEQQPDANKPEWPASTTETGTDAAPATDDDRKEPLPA